MRAPVAILPAVAVFVLGLPCLAADEAPPAKAYAVLEIARFEVNREDFSSKVAERAGRVPDEVLDTIHRVLITEFTEAKVFPSVRKAGSPGAGEGILDLSGRIVDWLPGSQAKRYFVGLGAGQQKIEVECVLKDKTTGAILGRETILDRKVAGIGGGSEEKGVRDFAEKVVVFVRQALEKGGAAPQ